MHGHRKLVDEFYRRLSEFDPYGGLSRVGKISMDPLTTADELFQMRGIGNVNSTANIALVQSLQLAKSTVRRAVEIALTEFWNKQRRSDLDEKSRLEDQVKKGLLRRSVIKENTGPHGYGPSGMISPTRMQAIELELYCAVLEFYRLPNYIRRSLVKFLLRRIYRLEILVPIRSRFFEVLPYHPTLRFSPGGPGFHRVAETAPPTIDFTKNCGVVTDVAFARPLKRLAEKDANPSARLAGFTDETNARIQTAPALAMEFNRFFREADDEFRALFSNPKKLSAVEGTQNIRRVQSLEAKLLNRLDEMHRSLQSQLENHRSLYNELVASYGQGTILGNTLMAVELGLAPVNSVINPGDSILLARDFGRLRFQVDAGNAAKIDPGEAAVTLHPKAGSKIGAPCFLHALLTEAKFAAPVLHVFKRPCPIQASVINERSNGDLEVTVDPSAFLNRAVSLAVRVAIAADQKAPIYERLSLFPESAYQAAYAKANALVTSLRKAFQPGSAWYMRVAN